MDRDQLRPSELFPESTLVEPQCWERSCLMVIVVINSVYRPEEAKCNKFWTLYCISEVPLWLQVSWPVGGQFESDISLGVMRKT